MLELMIVLALIVIIAAIAIPSMKEAKITAKDAVLKARLFPARARYFCSYRCTNFDAHFIKA